MTATRLEREPQHASRAAEGAAWRSVEMVLTLVVMMLPVVFLTVMGYQRRWLSDDGFISLRVARNALDGYGPVFNVGQRVETHTNPLWVALLTAWGATGASLEHGAVWLGLVLSVGGLIGALAGGTLLVRRMGADRYSSQTGLLFPLGAVVFVSLPVVWDFTTAGLESGLVFGWLGLSFWMLARLCTLDLSRLPAQWSMAALTFGLGPLIRPDMAVFSAGFLFALVVLRALRSHRRTIVRTVGDLAMLALVAAIVPVTYQIVRMGYFALLTPNTALAKEAGMTHWGQGWLYLNDFAGIYRLWIPLAVIFGFWAVTALRAGQQRNLSVLTVLLFPVLSAVIHSVYIVRVGGDFMHGRFLLPTLFVLLLPVAVVRLSPSRRYTLRSLVDASGLAIVLVWAVASAVWMRPPYGDLIGPDGIADERGVYVSEARHDNPITLADYEDFIRPWLADGLAMRARADDYPRIFVFDGHQVPLRPDVHPEIGLAGYGLNIGILGFAAGPQVHVVDHFGLSDPIGSRMLVVDRGRPGHEKTLPIPWAIARYGDPAADEIDDPHVMAAREALACGQLPELFRAIEEPLTLQRFLENIRLAPTLQRLRIPPNTMEARDALCGPNS